MKIPKIFELPPPGIGPLEKRTEISRLRKNIYGGPHFLGAPPIFVEKNKGGVLYLPGN